MGVQNISTQFKKLLIWIAIITASLISIVILWFILSFFWNLIFPPKPADPNLAFGKITKPFIYNFQPKNADFILDTVGGRLKNITSILPVYAIPAPEGKFVSLDQSKKIASGANLDTQPSKLSDFEWRFSSTKNPSKSLIVNIVSKNFVYAYDWVADPSGLIGVFKTTEEKIVEKARNYLSSFKSLKADLKKSSSRVSYWKLVGQEKNKVGSFSEANAALVELFRSDIVYKNKEYPIFESNPNLSLVNLLISPSNLLELNFTYWGVEFDKFATYDLKTSRQAYQDLSSGKAFIPTNPNLDYESITITDFQLGYLNPSSSSVRYLQPIFAFEGEAVVNGEKQDFLAYVLAVKNDYIK